MQGHNAKPPQELDTLDDIELAQPARRQDGNTFRSIMQRNNRRCYRVVRSVVPDASDAKDAVQEADVRTFGSLGQFRGDSSLATWPTWPTRITLRETLGRLRRHRPMVELAVLAAQPSGKSQVIPFPLMPPDEVHRLANP
jgi:RNA polymerase sigma-70 factor, ECF subfamily